MKRTLLSGAAAALFACAGAQAALAPQAYRLHDTATGDAAAATLRPQAFGGVRSRSETAALSRLDGSLRAIPALLSRAAASGSGASTALDRLKALRNADPSLRLRVQAPTAQPEVLVDVIADGDVDTVRNQLEALGLRNAAVFANDIGGWLPVDQLAALQTLDGVRLARASRPRTRAGAVTTQGDYAQRSDVIRNGSNPSGVTGSGVKVGVLSDSYNCYAQYAGTLSPSGATGYAQNGYTATAANDAATGDLPSTVTLVNTAAPAVTGQSAGEADCYGYDPTQDLPLGDEGRAMMQIVHDVAPGVSLLFHTASNSEADFANGIVALANAGAKVIVDDVGYPDEPFFQDGILAQAVNQVQAAGVAYFSAAGNDGINAYDNTAPSFPVTAASGTLNAGDRLLNVDTSGKTTATILPVSIPALAPGEYINFVLQWDQPYVTGAPSSGGATSQLDLCEGDTSGNLESCAGYNAVGADPVVGLAFGNPANSGGSTQAVTIGLQISLVSGVAPGRVKLLVSDNGIGATINTYATNTATLQGHAGTSGAISVGAVFFYNTPRCGSTALRVEDFSARGGAPILFDASGKRLATPVVRAKPDVLAPDGGNNTFFGYVLAGQVSGLPVGTGNCQTNGSYPNFLGTSAAAPHAAGIAALMLQAQPAATPTQIANALRSTAIDGGSSGFDYDYGYGYVQADAAFAQIVPTSSGGSGSSGSGGGGAFAPLSLLALGGLAALRRRRRPVMPTNGD